MAGQLGRQQVLHLYFKVHSFLMSEGCKRTHSKLSPFCYQACQLSHYQISRFYNPSLCKLLSSTVTCSTKLVQRLNHPAIQCHGMTTACLASFDKRWISSSKLTPKHQLCSFASNLSISGWYCDSHWRLSARHCTKLNVQFRFASKMPMARKEAQYRIIDRVPKNLELLYRAPMNTYLATAQAISSVCLLTLLCMLAFKVGVGAPFLQFPVSLGLGTHVQNSTELFISLSGFGLATLGIYGLASRYPLRIYGDHEVGNYASIFLSPVPFQTRQVTFQAGDVKQDNRSGRGIVPWGNAQFRIGKHKVILLTEYFRKPADLHAMMEPVSPPSEEQS